MPDKPAIYTIGHSTHPLEEFVDILKSHDVDYLVDVRTIPRSRTNPQFNKDALPKPLQVHGIAYQHIAELGGLRSKRKESGESPNSFWQNKSFRNYADYAMTGTFRKGLEELKGIAAHHKCAMMCAEAVWWRCHRRIIGQPPFQSPPFSLYIWCQWVISKSGMWADVIIVMPPLLQ